MTATMRPLKTSDAPTPFLVPDPKTGDVLITSDSAADHALRELAYISAHKAALNAKCDQDAAKLKEQCEAAQVVEIAGETISYKARSQSLTAALERFIRSKYPTLKQGSGPRSLKLTHGKLCWQKSRAKVDFIKGGSAAKTVQAIDEATQWADGNGRGLIEKIARLLKSIRLFVETPIRYVGLVVTLKATIDRTLALKSYKAQQLSDEDLKKLGLKFVAGGDKFVAKPDSYDVTNREG